MKNAAFIVLIILNVACNDNTDDEFDPSSTSYRQEMRTFVESISTYAHSKNANFIIIPQNGIELITQDGEPDGTLATSYIDAIDGVGQEDLFYGYNNDNEATPTPDNQYLTSFLSRLIDVEKRVLVTDYCSTPLKMDDSYVLNRNKQYISFAAPDRELSVIPTYPTPVFAENSNNVSNLFDADNFLYLINPSNFSSADDMIAQMKATNYDVLIIDAFFNDVLLTANQVNQLKLKANGGTRKVIAYMSIGEAEDYRYYWQTNWKVGNPSFIKAVNPDWAGNYKVAYWDAEWQKVIYGSNDAYLDKLLNAEFDGTYLDIIDGFEYFENQ